jgi:hypothetical protein
MFYKMRQCEVTYRKYALKQGISHVGFCFIALYVMEFAQIIFQICAVFSNNRDLELLLQISPGASTIFEHSKRIFSD